MLLLETTHLEASKGQVHLLCFSPLVKCIGNDWLTSHAKVAIFQMLAKVKMGKHFHCTFWMSLSKISLGKSALEEHMLAFILRTESISGNPFHGLSLPASLQISSVVVPHGGPPILCLGWQ